MEDLLHKIIEGWYIYDNALFEISLSHELRENSRISCPFRSGKGLIEYNPNILSKLKKEQIEELLKIECVRIILKHPYERQPVGCRPKARSVGSDIIIADNYTISHNKLNGSTFYNFEKDKSFEWYSYLMEEFYTEEDNDGELGTNSDSDENGEKSDKSIKGNGDAKQNEDDNLTDKDCDYSDKSSKANGDSDKDGGEYVTYETEKESSHSSAGTFSPSSSNNSAQEESLSDKSGLWEEDSFMDNYLNIIVEKIESSSNWGSIPGNMAEAIVANARARIDYRKVLSGFRASILSSKRNLTRMRPNRRTGFENMGSIRRLNTHLLVAIDVSGSVSSTSLSVFLSVVNNAFRYGIEELDLVTFDTEIHDVYSFKKAQKNIKISGRGGTNFQPVIDYAVCEKYDGVLFFSDGFAPAPKVPPFKGLKIAWVIDTLEHYNEVKDGLSKVGRCCVIDK